MIKVVHIQYSTASAGSAAYRLQKAFLNANIDSSIVSLRDNKINDKKIKSTGRWSRWVAKLDFKIQSYLTRKNIKEFGLFSYPILGTDVSEIEEIKKADYIYIHWALYGFLSLRSIDKLAKLKKPIIFFMHDMWNITGGCHHSFTCEKYTISCSNCQMLSGRKSHDLARKEFNRKIKLYSKYSNLYFVSPSKWLYECAKKALLTKDKPIFCIPNVIDLSLFKSFDKIIARQILNLNNEETVIAFGAVSIGSPYKGWEYLQKGLEILERECGDMKLSVLIFGSGYDRLIEDNIPFKTKFMGYLNDEYSTALVYNAVDVFIAPSLADNLPFTVFEALSCGTPVVAFNTGGIPDLIEHTKNGYLARYKDAEDIAKGIEFCLKNAIKGYLPPGFETDLSIKKHLELFDYIQSKN